MVSPERHVRRRKLARPDEFVEEETLKVYTSSQIANGEGRGETERREVLSVRKFLVEPAYVRVNQGATKNMGNYESLRVDISVTVPCYVEEIDEVVPALADKVSLLLEDELGKF